MVRTESNCALSLVDVPESAQRFEFTRRLPIRLDVFTDYTGRTYGKLTVVGLAGYSGVYAVWLCRCECGSQTIIRVNRLNSSSPPKSCGHCSGVSSDGLRNRHPLYFTWRGMLGRCHDKNDNSYHYYGARGIQVCDRWRTSFRNFIEDMGEKPSPKHTVDRVDNNGNYEPSNCIWSTYKEQMQNKRPRSKNRKKR